MFNTDEEPKQTEINFFFLSKKTRRGRKSNFQLPEGLRCTICLEFDEFSLERIVKCGQCQSLFHPSCYAKLLPNDRIEQLQFDNVKNKQMICVRCLYANAHNKSFESIKCGICNMSSGILQQNNAKSSFFHPFCKRFIPELEEKDKTDDSSLRKWRYKNSCHYCKAKLSKDQPVVKCLNPKCKEFYHIPCAIEKGMIFSIMFLAEFYNKDNKESIPFFCFCHNKRLIQKYKENMYDWNRKSSKSFSDSHDDSHSETIDDSYKKDIKQEDNSNGNKSKTSAIIKIPSVEPKEFSIDFQMQTPFCAENNYTNNSHQCFEFVDQRGLYNNHPEENDQLNYLMNLFTMENFFKQIERDNDSRYMN